MRNKLKIIIAAALCLPLTALADNRFANNQDQSMRARMGDVKDPSRFQAMINESAEVYDAIAKGAHGEVPMSVLNNARCIAVLPNVVTGALLVGGTYGEGLASCKDSSNVWSQPAPISLKQGSFGLQAGAKSADLLFFFQNKEAVQALKRGNFALGADVSAVAGSYEANVDTSNAGVVVYSRTEGVFAGASVNGAKIGKDQKDLNSYYGRKVDYRNLLEGKVTPDTTGYTDKLTRLFP
jgi:lipid-binding SYLF domain-containing protein